MAEKSTEKPARTSGRKTKTSGRRQHIFMENMELLLVRKYQEAKRLTFSAAACHLMMVGLRAEDVTRSNAATALTLMSETIANMGAELDLLRAAVVAGQDTMNANFDALHKSSGGAYLAARQLVAKLDPAAFDRLDQLTKSYLSKLGIDRDSAIAAASKSNTSRN